MDNLSSKIGYFSILGSVGGTVGGGRDREREREGGEMTARHERRE